MERWVSASPVVKPFGFVSWAEVFVSNDKGRREVHYYLKRSDGSLDLALVGKEKSSRHMSYHYAFKNRSLFAASFAKLKSRREVIDWLNSLVSGAPAFVDGKDGCGLGVESMKATQIHRMVHNAKEFLWLGSPWTCRKKRRHYQSFQRNGVKISVYDFVYVLAEEGKHLVAYLEDMYEDSRGNKMVVVRWFHKIDEVGLILPNNYNDREIFFSLCLQDLSIECIDGLATVLSPQHYEKFLKEARHTLQDPFVCDKQFENDDIAPFDITQVKGYWKQDMLNYIRRTLSPSKDIGGSHQLDDVMKLDNVDSCGIRPKKRQCIEKRDAIDLTSVDGSILAKSGMSNLKGGSCATAMPNEVAKQDSSLPFAVGSLVEVFTQDSGIRGCWFRALIIKKHKDKLKVQYQDVQDAADETKKLEEWILASRVAALDRLGLRLGGRTVVRPVPPSNSGQSSGIFKVGTVVDVWWHDGWWEGVVVQKESDNSFHVYLPEEKHSLFFGRSELRHSKEWFGNGWTLIKERPDVVTSILHELEKQVSRKSSPGNKLQATLHESKLLKDDDACSIRTRPVSENVNQGNFKECSTVMDLSKDNLLAQLRWRSSKKRRRSCGVSVQKVQCSGDGKTVAPDAVVAHACERFLIPTSLKIDVENCKYAGDSLFNSSVVPTLNSLVMSR